MAGTARIDVSCHSLRYHERDKISGWLWSEGYCPLRPDLMGGAINRSAQITECKQRRRGAGQRQKWLPYIKFQYHTCYTHTLDELHTHIYEFHF